VIALIFFILFFGVLFVAKMVTTDEEKRKKIENKVMEIKKKVLWGAVIDSLLLQFIMNLVICKLSIDMWLSDEEVS
jgi:uncharacterized membrane protein YeiB